MIKLHYSQGSVLIYDADDWATLRKTHRILGTLVGNTNTVQTLPLKLLPEEVLLLLDKKLAKLIDSSVNITPEIRDKYEQFENVLLEEEKVMYKNNRKRQLESMIGDIVAAKRKRGDNRSVEEIFTEELEKSSKINREIMIWPTFLTPLSNDNEFIEVSKDEILKNTTELKYSVYRDLWERGYYITTGFKFGADFLVYLGDPIAYHAIFIVHCIDNPDDVMHSSEIVSFGRLATAVKKRAVLATSQNEKISYITINWIDA
ncbi:tRNA-splicing endonuclease subunit Sen34 [Tribolium castaneum]|uniref:tRNA-splicing endonuclease subunit Sen34 n=1 Tax=Tribolium castaneum TaxID=7070 RepID=UPI0030FE2317